MSSLLRIGTRASKLALAQAEMVRDALAARMPEMRIEIVAMTTAGDRELHKQLSDWGYKGLFTKELEDALLTGQVDIAVHSMKDMPSILPPGLRIAALLPRADVRDAWISAHYASLAEVPKGGIIGTSSTRRAAQLLHVRRDVTIVPLRGNVQTRLRKLEENVASATFLAAAGLTRLGLTHHIRAYLPVEDFLPAAAQGAVGIECLDSRTDLHALLASLDDAATSICVTAERAMLRVLDGSCRTPIGGLAELSGDMLTLRAEVLSLDGKIRHQHQLSGTADDAEALGVAVGDALRATAGEEMLKHG
jgi:hydroxymethylbilane synthase